MNSIGDIKQLYILYGFELLDETSDYLVFQHSEGYFSNIEILKLTPAFDTSAISKEYSDVGYAVKNSDYKSYGETHAKLFNGFFFQKNITTRLSAEYQRYSAQQAQKLGCKFYKFIPCKFVGNCNEIESDVVNHIYNQLFQNGSQLIIVEAAAGFGKTSISYEVIKKLAEDSQGTVPIITELSKNRRAQIFKYVLLSEIDTKFRGLSSELVESEIKNGNVPLIIDGFDELLSKSISQDPGSSSDDTEAAQTMLSTVAQLLCDNSKAKIVLTSRKSSIFSGDMFTEWADKYLGDCEITRIQIIPPTISDWLTKDQLSILQEKKIGLKNISNPTLLTFLSSKSCDELDSEFQNIDDILDEYFEILLLRERERQILPLSPEEQLKIMKNVAWNMVGLDETAFSPEDLKIILSMSLSEEEFHEYMDRYEQAVGIENIPTEDEFFAKLAHHALLDRMPNTSNLIGFINDFIFGYLIGTYLLENIEEISKSINAIKEKYWDLMITAYSACSVAKRDSLYELFISSGLKFSPIMRLNAESLLMNSVTNAYQDNYFDSITFTSPLKFSPNTFNNCTFSFCIFNKCEISSSSFSNCKFYSCQFYDVQITDDSIHNCHLIFSNCSGAEELIAKSNHEALEVCVSEEESFERKVLEQYWRPGSDHADRRRLFNTLFRGYSQQDYAGISAAIDRLCTKNILIRKNYCIELNFSEMLEVRKILGR